MSFRIRTVKGMGVAGLCLLLFLTLDLIISVLVFRGVPREVAARQFHDDVNRAYRVSHDVFHHTLRPNFDGIAMYGPVRYRLRTNSLGFADQRPREVEKLGEPRATEFVKAGLLDEIQPKQSLLEFDGDGHMRRHRIDHGLDAIGDKGGLGHQTGTKRTALHALTGAAAVEVDLVVTPLHANFCSARKIITFATAEL